MAETIEKKDPGPYNFVPISPLPKIDTSVDQYDYIAVIESRDEYYKAQLIRLEEINCLRDKLRWCYKREGVNHFKNCRTLALQYLDMCQTMKDGWIVPFKRTAPGAELEN